MGKRRRQNKIDSKFYYFFFVYTIKLDQLCGAEQIRPMSTRIRLKQRKNKKTQETTGAEEEALIDYFILFFLGGRGRFNTGILNFFFYGKF